MDSSRITVLGNTFDDPGGRLYISGSTEVTASGNLFLRDGITLEGSQVSEYASHTITTDNLIAGRPVLYYRDRAGLNVDGVPAGQVIVANCSGVRVSGLATPPTSVALMAAYVQDLDAAGNVFDSDYIGVYAVHSSNVTVEDNTVSNGTGMGVNLYQVTGAVVRRNRFVDDAQDVYLLSSASGVRVYHNEFLGAGSSYDGAGAANAWDDGYPSGGNYWSSYAGPDDCSGPAQDACPDSDGVGDVPVVLDANSRDRYPLMAPPPAANLPPTASFTASPSTVETGVPVTVDASGVSDPEDSGAVLKVRWDWEDDGTWDTLWSTGKTATHAYPAAGTFTARMEVRDTSRLAANTTRQVVVTSNTPPAATFTASPTRAPVSADVTFDASASSDLEDSTAALEVRWDWEDDGTWDTSWSTTKTAVHRYPAVGVYTVRLEVRDTGGLVDSASGQVEVIDDTPPVIVHVPHGDAGVNAAITITVQVTDDTAVEDVTLHYKPVGASSFVEVRMDRASGDTYVATIPAQTNAGTVYYFVNATDGAGNEARHPQTGEHSLQVTQGGGPPPAEMPWLLILSAAALAAVAVAGVVGALLLRRRKARDGKAAKGTGKARGPDTGRNPPAR